MRLHYERYEAPDIVATVLEIERAATEGGEIDATESEMAQSLETIEDRTRELKRLLRIEE